MTTRQGPPVTAAALPEAQARALAALEAAPPGGLTAGEVRAALGLPSTWEGAREARQALGALADLGLAAKWRPLGEPDTWTTWGTQQEVAK